jgi:16S rRNA (cytosine1402-N4)-methyltransferase
MEIVHTSVMAAEALRFLAPQHPGQLLIDCTLGEGGHTAAFLQAYPDLQVCGIDADAEIQAKARQRLAAYGGRVEYFLGWYNDFFANYPLIQRPDRILFDFGISIFHYVESGRGFSFSKDEALDMRLNPDAGPSVAQVLATIAESELADLIFRYGEERYSRRIARLICQERQLSPITQAKQLAELIWRAVPADYRHGRLHPATRTFQALRIYVNRELERIEAALSGAFKNILPGGIMGVITFHSLEDRVVKHYFKSLTAVCHCPPEQLRCNCGREPFAQLVERKAIVPSAEECRMNPPSRSAKFRFIKKLRELE